MKMHLNKIFFFASIILFSCNNHSDYDVIVLGGGAGGTSAAIQSARNGAKTLLIEETNWLGGMLTSAGVSAVDGNYNLPSGFWGEFKDSLVSHYGTLESLKTGWVSNVLFEPRVGNRILKSIAKSEKNLKILFSTQVNHVTKLNKEKHGFTIKSSKGNFNSKILIDGTELGDILPILDEDYDIGMDDRDMYGEEIAPIKKNDIIQDFTYVMILKNYKKNVKIDKPDNYNPSEFYCSTSSVNCDNSDKVLWSPEKMMSYGKLPNDNIMINWPIYGNDYYSNLIDMSDIERNVIFKNAKNKSLRFLYYIQNELGYENYSLSNNEFDTKDNFPLIPYYREARRIKGMVTFSLNYIKNPYNQIYPLYRTGILVGDYPVDHHHDAHPDSKNLPQLAFYPIPSYSLPIGTIISKKNKNLLVAEKSISVSNLVNGTTRLQPVVLQIGQIAGLIASESVRKNINTHEIDIREIQTKFLDEGGYIQPFLDVEKDHIFFKAYQRIGVTGILRGSGINVGWSNQTWFYPENQINFSELLEGLNPYYDLVKYPLKDLKVSTVFEWVSAISGKDINEMYLSWVDLGLNNFSRDKMINRGEFAIIVDHFLKPFENFKVDFNGNIINE